VVTTRLESMLATQSLLSVPYRAGRRKATRLKRREPWYLGIGCQWGMV
jgi:hypothetical protein